MGYGDRVSTSFEKLLSTVQVHKSLQLTALLGMKAVAFNMENVFHEVLNKNCPENAFFMYTKEAEQ